MNMKSFGIVILAIIPVLIAAYFLLSSPIGGEFTLTDQDGKPFSSTSTEGKYTLVFFGYTQCPDECPMTLQKIAMAMETLNKDRATTAALFITVDPEHDTPAQLKSYLAHFNTGITGLTGTQKQIRHVENLYGAIGDDTSGEVEHSDYVYLMDRQGKYLTHFSLDVTPQDIISRIRGYMNPKT